ncbi:hypothetical protein SASPL_150542 [Salvia splendens]|uniref:Uncharacterized protein n=1 Tax=Salvia splendens TaxID=180675 RepID=A0A8X8Z2J5_SALSN|nr:hypothetical protein SASPL_150542 [Salvia splendens]
MVDTQKSSTENSGHQLRSGLTSVEAQQYTRKHPAKSKTVKQATHKLDADPGNKIPDPEGKTSSPTRKNASSSEIPTGKPVTKGKTSSQKKMNASSSEIPTEIPAKKAKGSSVQKLDAAQGTKNSIPEGQEKAGEKSSNSQLGEKSNLRSEMKSFGRCS